jgi:hypothetical protein
MGVIGGNLVIPSVVVDAERFPTAVTDSFAATQSYFGVLGERGPWLGRVEPQIRTAERAIHAHAMDVRRWKAERFVIARLPKR